MELNKFKSLSFEVSPDIYNIFWGGTKLKTNLNRSMEENNIKESLYRFILMINLLLNMNMEKQRYVISLALHPGANYILDFKDIYNKENFKKVIKEGNLEYYLNEIKVNEGDFFVPPGTFYAIGGDLIIIEIQQNSNIAYRLYDWYRVDHKENKSKLHLKKSLVSTKFKDSNKVKNSKITDQYNKEILCISEYFVTEKNK